jgi:flagellar basal-body rod protein FlgB
MPANLFDVTLEGIGKALTLHQRRHQVLASNLANVETPGFRAKEMDFKAALRDAFAEPGEQTGQSSNAISAVIEDPEGPMRSDGNSVDVDLQMAKLASNSSRFNTLAKVLGKRFALLRQAIDGVR